MERSISAANYTESKLPVLYQSLFDAIFRNAEEHEIAELVRQGADLSYCLPDTGATPLYTATIADRALAVKALLEHGANPNQRFTYRSPIDKRIESDRIALYYAHSAEVAAALIHAGSDVNAADGTGTTPLMRKAYYGDTSVVTALLAAGASPLTRQQKRRGHKPYTARELTQIKIAFFRIATLGVKNEVVQRRLECYEEIHEILLLAEKQAEATEQSK